MATKTNLENGEKSPEQIEQEIEHTRAEMSETIDALEKKLNPERLKAKAAESIQETVQHAKEEVIHTARQATSEVMDTARGATIGRAEELVHDAEETAMEVGITMMNTIRDNPLPAALAGLGLGWLLMGRRGASRSTGGTRDYERPHRREFDTRSEEYGLWRGGRDIEDEGVMDEVRDRYEDFVEQSPVNPVPAALAALGIGWLFMEGRDRQPTHRRRGALTYPRGRGYASGRDYREDAERSAEAYADKARRMGRNARHRVTDLADDAQQTLDRAEDRASGLVDEAQQTFHQMEDRASDLVDEAQQTIDKVEDRAKHFADDAQQRAGTYSRQARRYARRAPSQLEQLVKDNPLLAGAVAVAIGAAIGGSLPHTRYEDEHLGPKSDELTEKVRERADEALDQAASTARETMNKVQHVAEESAKAARDELRGEDVVGQAKSAAKDVARDAAQTARAAAQEATETARKEAKSEGLVGGNGKSSNSNK